LEATYIFPLEQESQWIQLGFARWITDIDDSTGSSKIDSAQNGFLLNECAQALFNCYMISVNPDDGYKVVVFGPDLLGYNGRVLDPVCRNPADPHRVSDQLLRWHFRQSVLANMRGEGGPLFEYNFDHGTDILGETLAGPYEKERFELEMAVRLREFHKREQEAIHPCPGCDRIFTSISGVTKHIESKQCEGKILTEQSCRIINNENHPFDRRDLPKHPPRR